jgi:hypothetical protein
MLTTASQGLKGFLIAVGLGLLPFLTRMSSLTARIGPFLPLRTHRSPGYLTSMEFAESLGQSDAGVLLSAASGRAAPSLQQHPNFTQPFPS